MKHFANNSLFRSYLKRAAFSFAACGVLFLALQPKVSAQWTQSTGYSSNSMYGFYGISFAGSNYLVVSVQAMNAPPNDSLYSSTDNGQTWAPFGPNGGLPLVVVSNNSLPNLVGRATFKYSDGSYTGILSYSTDYADRFQTWAPDTLGFPTSQPSNDPLASALVTIGSTIYAADGAYGVYQQTAPGARWTADTVGMTLNGTPYSVGALIVSGNNIYASTYGAGVLESTNQGASWVPANSGLTTPALPGWTGPGGATFALSGTTLFAMIPNNNYGFDTAYNFYRWSDNAQNWTLMNSAPLKGGVGVITNFTASAQTLFAAHDSTVNFSNDNGATWQQGNQGLPVFGSNNITAIQISGSNLVIGTILSDQIWYRPLSQFASLSVAPSSDATAGVSLTLSGNPASGSEVKAIFTLADAGVVQVKLMDELGREVRMLQNGHASKGQNMVTIDPLTVEAGTYFVRVEANGTSAMQKLVITR